MSVSKDLSFSQTDLVFFLLSFVVTKATTIWSAWWAYKLKEIAHHIKSADQDSPRVILTTIVTQAQANLRANLMTITRKFWTFQPSKNMSLQSFIKEYLKRLNELKQNCSISTNTKLDMKYFLLLHISSINPDLANRCRSSFEDFLNECLQCISTAKIKSSTSIPKTTKCNYRGILGHIEPECRKKKRMEKEKMENKSKISNKSNVNYKILSVNNPENSSY
ncbi:putative serine threonine protein kinase domain protein [Erysiphe necator]|uniref:Putative serine threonine protein kinase domain protein n=1 Tax=Uncinula necator TaxID=52586 RepID=A0A0B1P4T0_UNCNE|nr:putative serine threonine protein kinase domain protein [Erysiphe necator]